MRMIKPFYQGKLDTFCAIYAVLNALRLTHGIRTSKAREILNATLLGISENRKLFEDVLYMRTNYVDMVDGVLQAVSQRMPLEVVKPFPNGASPDEFWQETGEWLAADPKSAVIFRFLRYLKPDADALNKHWTTADSLENDILHLFDCSHEAEAILNIRKDSFVTRTEDVNREKLLCIQPESARFARLPF